MRDIVALLALPACLLGLIAEAQSLEWPYNLPRTARYYPEDADLVRRGAEAQQQLAWQAPAGIRKMGTDEGEKFYLHYWDLGDTSGAYKSNGSFLDSIGTQALRKSANPNDLPLALFGRSIFARQYQCPANTTSCGSNSLCCPNGEVCSVQSSATCCCPAGTSSCTCSNSCAAGYTSCPNSPNGGCCPPGSQCDGTGCLYIGTATTVVTLPTNTVTSGASYSTMTSGSGTTTFVAPVTSSTSQSGYTTTVTVTTSLSGGMTTIVSPTTLLVGVSAGTSTITSAQTQGSLTCTSGFMSCPASLGGGCCPNGQICGTSGLCPDATTSTTSVTGGAPIRPTSVSTSDTAISGASVASTSTSDVGCPTGFYMCSAYYQGGCCRVGRNCDSTSCPASTSTEVISSQPTVVVPVTSTTVGGAGAAEETQGSCAGGWYSCDASAGGGCCPSGLVCGASSCSATASGQQNTGKEAPSEASLVRWTWSFLVLAIGSGIGMLYL